MTSSHSSNSTTFILAGIKDEFTQLKEAMSNLKESNREEIEAFAAKLFTEKPEILEQQDENGCTLLHLAIHNNDIKMFLFINEFYKKKDPEYLSKLDLIVQFAVVNSSATMLKAVIDEIPPAKRHHAVTEMTDDGYNALRIAAELRERIFFQKYKILLPYATENPLANSYNTILLAKPLLDRYATQSKDNEKLKQIIEHSVKITNAVTEVAPKSAAHPELNTAGAERKDVISKWNELENEFDQAVAEIKDPPNSIPYRMEFLRLKHEKMKKYGVGNCQDLAALGLKISNDINPEIRAELYTLMPGAHSFLVFGREGNIDNAKDYTTWGENAVVCDLLTKEIYPAAEITQKMKYWEKAVTEGAEVVMGNANFNYHELELNKISIQQQEQIKPEKSAEIGESNPLENKPGTI